MANMRGLAMFISDIRNCSTKEAEQKRVLRELAKIREKFANTRKQLNSYDKKKYVWKLLYMFMLGYDINFGHAEAINLICAPRYTEKYTGYMAASLLLSPKSPQLEQVVNAIRNDIIGYDPPSQSLALATVANLGGSLLTDELNGDLVRLVTEGLRSSQQGILKKAVNCLARLFKEDKSILKPADWSPKIKVLLELDSCGMLMSTCNLLLDLLSVYGYREFTPCYPDLVRSLARLATTRSVGQDYMYYQTPCPWLQIKLLRILQFFPYPIDQRLQMELTECLERITARTEVTPSLNKNNTDHSILFEAIKLIIHYKEEAPQALRTQCSSLLGRFISVKESNIRYIGLETMALLAQNSSAASMLERHLSNVLISLRDPDISIRKRALDVMFGMCTDNNANEIVSELLDVLDEADYNIKEDLVMKAALLAERFGHDLQWYLDVIFKLITYAGDYVSNDVWYRVVQVVTGFGTQIDYTLQEYAATRAFLALSEKHAHENMVKLGSYLISEFSSYLLRQGKSAVMLFDLVHKHFPVASTECKSIMLSAYMKLAAQHPDLVDTVLSVFQGLMDHVDPDLQQRAYEYYYLVTTGPELIPTVMEAMPPYKEDLKQQNMFLTRIVSMGETKPERTTHPPVQQAPSAPAAHVAQQAPPAPPAAQQPPSAAASVNLLDL